MVNPDNILMSLHDVPHGAKICIYGTGRFGRDVRKFLELHRKDIKLVSYIDNVDHEEVDGIKVINIKDFKMGSLECDLILIASSSMDEIIDNLHKKLIKNYMIFDSKILERKVIHPKENLNQELCDLYLRCPKCRNNESLKYHIDC